MKEDREEDECKGDRGEDKSRTTGGGQVRRMEDVLKEIGRGQGRGHE